MQKRREKDKSNGKTGPAGKGKTYTRKRILGSHNENDDENENEDINSEAEEGEMTAAVSKKKIPVLDLKTKAEMKRLADKFREVDAYALEYEDMTGSSSQMRDAR